MREVASVHIRCQRRPGLHQLARQLGFGALRMRTPQIDRAHRVLV